MGNLISSECSDPPKWVKMNNGLTEVVIAILAMAASAEAQTVSQRRIAVRINWADQNRLGRGTVGFDISELGWTNDQKTFDQVKAFLLRSIDRAIAKTDWPRCPFRVNEDWALKSFTKLRILVEKFVFDAISESDARYLESAPENLTEPCKDHGILLGKNGCVLCNVIDSG